MKIKRILLCLLGVLLLCSALTVTANAQTYPTELTLSGVGRVTVPSDRLTVCFEILTYSSRLQKAQEENQRMIQTVTESLTAYGKPTQEGYYCYEGLSGTRFFVSSVLSLTTDKVGGAEEICALLKTDGIAAIHDVRYECTDPSSYEEEALQLAIQDAERKVDALGLLPQAIEIVDTGCYLCGNQLEYSVRVTYHVS